MHVRFGLASLGVAALSGAVLGFGIQPAIAAPAAPDVTAGSTVSAHPLDAGTVRIDFGQQFVGFEVTSTASDPTAPGTFSVVTGDVTADGSVTLTNYAGFADIDLAVSDPLSVPQATSAPVFRYDIGIWRAQTVDYTYSLLNGRPYYTLVGPAPQPVVPATSAEAQSLTAVATSTVSPTSWQPGSDLALQFDNVTPTGVGYPSDSVTVNNVVYSDATALGTSPTATSTATSTSTTTDSLANTGQTDVVPAGIAAVLLFGAGALGLGVARYRRRASAHRD